MSSEGLSKNAMIKHIRALNRTMKDSYVVKNLPKLSKEQLQAKFNQRFEQSHSAMTNQKFYKPKGDYSNAPKKLSDAEWMKLSPHKPEKKKDPAPKEKKPIKFKVTKKEEPKEKKPIKFKVTKVEEPKEKKIVKKPFKINPDEFYLRIKFKDNKTGVIKAGKTIKAATKKFTDRRAERKEKPYKQMTLFKGDQPTKPLEFSA